MSSRRPRSRPSSGKLSSSKALSLIRGAPHDSAAAQVLRSLTRAEALARLSDTDRDIVAIVCELRVVTTRQIQVLLGIADRTVRYRVNRLRDLGLVGTDRPYVESGSAPYHVWPTRVADAYAKGAAVPRGGEREAPNASFLAHAAGISGLYVALHVLGPQLGFTLDSWLRETDGREQFAYGDRTAAIVPDASVILRRGEDELHVFFELDLGTMSLPRLGKKLGLYAAYARREHWRDAHPYLPPLLVLTTTPKRAERVISTFEAKLAWEERNADIYSSGRLADAVIGACSLARQPERALAETVWLGRDGADGLGWLDIVAEPARKLREAHAHEQAREQARVARRASILKDPDALRGEFATHRSRRTGIDEFNSHLRGLGGEESKALRILLESTEPMSGVERQAFEFFVRRTLFDGDQPRAVPETVPPDRDDQRVIEALRRLVLRRQKGRVASLHARYPQCPSLLGVIRMLDEGTLLSHIEQQGLGDRVRKDLVNLKRDDGRARDYLHWRSQRAREKKQWSRGLNKLRPVELFEAELDNTHLAYCLGCERIVAPSGDDLKLRQPPRCRYCGRPKDELLSLTTAHERGLVVPDGGGYWLACPLPVPGWVRAGNPVDAETIEARE